jgi:hypothetical protein
MGWCSILLFTLAALSLGGWALAFALRRRAVRYRAAFERAFEIARRVYQFSDDEANELTRIIGEPIERRDQESTR